MELHVVYVGKEKARSIVFGRRKELTDEVFNSNWMK